MNKKNPELQEPSDMPWDVKEVRIELGGYGDCWLNAEIFNDNSFRISFTEEGEIKFVVDDMHMDVAKRLMDFLNYAVN